MRLYRLEQIAADALVASLDAISAEGWTLLSVHLTTGGSEPLFYCLWDKPA